MLNATELFSAFQTLAKALQGATIFPSLLIVLAHFYWALPLFSLDPNDKPNPDLLVVVISTLVLSYMLYAFNFLLIRLVEGYPWRDKFIGGLGSSRQRRAEHSQLQYFIQAERGRRFTIKRLLQETPATETEQRTEYARLLDEVETQLAQYETKFDQDYPAKRGSVLPTQLGNIIAAFEDYPRTRYGIDSIVLWPRLQPILREKGYLDTISQETGVFNFFLNAGLGSIFVGLELFYAYMYSGQILVAFIVPLLIGLWLILCGYALAESARVWGDAYRVAFDLYRHELWQRLNLKPVDSFPEEVALWTRVSQFLGHRPDPRSEPFDDFLPQVSSETTSDTASQP